jgi:hypothetical protein
MGILPGRAEGFLSCKVSGILTATAREMRMFRPEDIQARLREKPFRPLRIVASEGLRYDILHPDLVLVGNRDLMIGLPREPSGTIYDQVVRVALVHVVGLEDLPGHPASANGPA